MNVTLHKDYDPEEFIYDSIEKAWMAISGPHSAARYFFVGHLVNEHWGGGQWMAYLRRPNEEKNGFIDVPFESNYGFHTPEDAEIAIWNRHLKLGWRIEEADVNYLPTELPDYIKELL